MPHDPDPNHELGVRKYDTWRAFASTCLAVPEIRAVILRERDERLACGKGISRLLEGFGSEHLSELNARAERVFASLERGEAAGHEDLSVATIERAYREAQVERDVRDQLDALYQNYLHARNQLVERNMGLVRKLAAQAARHSPVSYEDLAQEGRLGLLRAAERYDPERAQLSTISYPWINKFLRDAQTDLVSEPAHAKLAARAITKHESRFRAQHGRSPSDQELRALTKLSTERIEQARATGGELVELDDEQVGELGEELENRTAARQVVEVARRVLSEQEFAVLQRVVIEGMPPNEARSELKMNCDRIRQIEERALQKLREALCD